MCEDCDAGEAEVWVSVANEGALFALAGISVALYADDSGADGFLVTVDDGTGTGGVIECDEANNEDATSCGG